MYATRWLSVLLPSPSITTAAFTSGCSSSASSISPGSIRYPLTFTCLSALPTYSISPLSTYLPKSPVLYILPPSSTPYGFGTYLSAVSSPFFTYPRPTPFPPMYISPTTPTPATSCLSSSTYTSTPDSARPITAFPLLPPSSPPIRFAVAFTQHSVGPYTLYISRPLTPSSSSHNPLSIFSPPICSPLAPSSLSPTFIIVGVGSIPSISCPRQSLITPPASLLTLSGSTCSARP